MTKDYRRKLSVEKFTNRKGEQKYIVVDGNMRPVSGISGQLKEEAMRIKKNIMDIENYASRYTIPQLRKKYVLEPKNRELIHRAIMLRRR